MTIDEAVKQCRIFLRFHEMPEEILPAMIAQAPHMYELIVSLLCKGALDDNPRYPARRFAREIVEAITGDLPDKAGEGTP